MTRATRNEVVTETRQTDEADMEVELDEEDRHLVEIAMARLRRGDTAIPDEEVWRLLGE